MSKIEYINPNPYPVTLLDENNNTVTIQPNKKVVLDIWFKEKYVPKYLRVVRTLNKNTHKSVKKNVKLKSKIIRKQPELSYKTSNSNSRKSSVKSTSSQNLINKRKKRKRPNVTYTKRHLTSNQKAIDVLRVERRHRVVGRSINAKKATTHFKNIINSRYVPISNNVAIGILSYNRLPSLRRCIDSIRKYTDLKKVTVFVADESTDDKVERYLSKSRDIVYMRFNKRVGIAGNTNRLLQCMSRFKHCFILNDDIEVLKPGWEKLYINAAKETNLNLLCFREPGIYGAKETDGLIKKKNNIKLWSIQEKPQGAFIYYNNEAFKKVGFFDEKFGEYGMEHVDWCRRIVENFDPKMGYCDVKGSHDFIMLHKDKSSVKDRGSKLHKARQYYEKVKNNKSRTYIETKTQLNYPKITYIIPVRNTGRLEAITTVINNIRSQRYPNIDIILIEQDWVKHLDILENKPLKYVFVKSNKENQHFNKSKAFNIGVSHAQSEYLVLHDGDIIVESGYTEKIVKLLKSNDGIHIGKHVIYFDRDSTKKVCKSGRVQGKEDCERLVNYFEGGSIACTKKAFGKIGGFNEEFEGYGCEDCDFFQRLKTNIKFYNERSEDFYHLWHSRVSGWEEKHNQNKRLQAQIKMGDKQQYIKKLTKALKTNYPQLYVK